LSLLRRWFKRRIGAGRPYFRSPKTSRSRFLAGRFKDPLSAPVLRPVQPLGLGYRLYLPSGSSRRDSLPLLVMLHGCGQDALSFAEGTRMNSLADARRCAVLYPEQSRGCNPLRCWNWFEPASIAGQGEAALLARLVEQVTARRPIDPQRVYAAGMSAGGAMACILALRHSRLFAACAIHSGVMCGAASSLMQAIEVMRSGPSDAAIVHARQVMSDAGESEVMVPALVIHGDRDTTVNPVNAHAIIEQFKVGDELIEPAGGRLLATDERRIVSGGRAYRQQDYARQGRVALRRVLVEGLGHAWSGGDPRHEFNDAGGPDASRLILDFVMQYERELRPIAAARAG
jgi:poly(hydroxyalkanoate) depolymerase family esterase